MLGAVEGVVTGLERAGFRLLNTWGTEMLVATMTDGRRLDLSVGDRLRVYGGPDRAGVFCCSSILRGEAEVPDAPRRPRPLLAWLGLR